MIKFILTTAIALVIGLASFAAGWTLAAEQINRSIETTRLRKQAMWTSLLDQQVRVGEPRAELDTWLTRHVAGFVDHADSRGDQINVDVEIFDNPVFPCGSSTLVVGFYFDADDRVVRHTVSTVGICF